MEPARVAALRATKALFDDGVLDQQEYEAKKRELLHAPAQQSVTPPPAAPIIVRVPKPLRWRRSRRVATTESGGKTLLLAFCKGRACLDNQASKFLAPHELRAVPCACLLYTSPSPRD